MKIKKITLKQANKITYKVFGHLFSKTSINYGNEKADFNLSFGLYDKNKLIGVYLLNENKMPNKKVKGKQLHGVSLCILPEYQKKGLGKLMIRHAESLGHSWIWGMHANNLNNLKHWLKTRKLLIKTSDYSITYKKIKLN